VPLLLAVLMVLVQVPYPLLDGEPLRLLTITSVLVTTAAALAHATVVHGARTAAAVLLAVGGTSLVLEAVGVRTGYPFGSYDYTGTLGPELLGVPVIVPLAWTMLAYPLLLAARVVCGGRSVLAVPATAGALAAWDLYLDPQMVDAGHWAWDFPEPHLPGMDGIPLTNLAGWLLGGLLVAFVLDRVLPYTPTDRLDPGPALVLGWTWLGSALALAVWLDRPGAALWGLVAMAPVVAPALLRTLRAGRTTTSSPLARAGTAP
jgi:putative membrane protein